MATLLTGGLGFIGSHTAVKLIESGRDVVIIDNLSNSCIEVLNRIEKITGIRPIFHNIDLRNENQLHQFFSNFSFDVVFHFAALKAVSESVQNPLDYYENNVHGTINLLSCISKTNINKFIFSSSATVYGEIEKLPAFEDSERGKITSPYGNSKYFVEQILEDFKRSVDDFNYISLRYFNPIGAHISGLLGEDPLDIPNNLVPIVCKVAAGSIKTLEIYGNDYPTKDGTCLRDYIHVDDLAEGHKFALDYLDKNNQSMNVNLGTGKPYSVLEVIKTFESVNKIKLNYKFSARRKGDIAKLYSDASLARDVLKWTPKLGLKEMLRDSWNFHKKNSK